MSIIICWLQNLLISATKIELLTHPQPCISYIWLGCIGKSSTDLNLARGLSSVKNQPLVDYIEEDCKQSWIYRTIFYNRATVLS